MLVVVSCLDILLLALILLDDLDSIFQIDSPEISGLSPQFSRLIFKIHLWKILPNDYSLIHVNPPKF